MPKNIIFPFNPVSAPRMTRADAWKKRPCVLKYFEYRNRMQEVIQRGKLELPTNIVVAFGIEMPKSWSDKKKSKMGGTPHRNKPDIDNLIKAFLDSFRGDDAKVSCITATKYWDYQGKTTMYYNTTN